MSAADMASHRSYADAITALNSLQTSFAVLEERRRQGLKMDDSAVREMRQWISRAGHAIPELDRLNIIHVAGTKGKGTTCAYVDSILVKVRALHGTPNKIGMYTSPHLLHTRERIRINSEPISEEAFAKYFFEVWDALEASALEDGRDPQHKPVYFRFLTLMSFHVFIREEVDTAIYEVGVGGAWDSTNVIERPAVTGITKLGIDHVVVLGDTIDKIAWHKAGIFKPDCPAFSVEQVPLATKVLEKRATDQGISLNTVEIHPALSQVKVVPDADFQRQNASLAVALVNALLPKLGQEALSLDGAVPLTVKQGLETTKWRGRCETISDGRKTWYLDGAHTDDSLRVGGRWFVEQAERRRMLKGYSAQPRILVFNQQSRPEAMELLETLYRSLQPLKFDHVLFCTNVTRKATGYRRDFVNRNSDPLSVANLIVQKGFSDVWKKLDPSLPPSKIYLLSTIQEAVELIDDFSEELGDLQIFVTGSLHLVGGTISILEGVLTPVSSNNDISKNSPALPKDA
ncbi:Folylpolyglutamate synthetase [Lecanora helva]